MATGASSNPSNLARLSSMANVFRVPDMRKKLLFTLAIILAYRFGS